MLPKWALFVFAFVALHLAVNAEFTIDETKKFIFSDNVSVVLKGDIQHLPLNARINITAMMTPKLPSLFVDVLSACDALPRAEKLIQESSERIQAKYRTLCFTPYRTTTTNETLAQITIGAFDENTEQYGRLNDWKYRLNSLQTQRKSETKHKTRKAITDQIDEIRLLEKIVAGKSITQEKFRSNVLKEFTSQLNSFESTTIAIISDLFQDNPIITDKIRYASDQLPLYNKIGVLNLGSRLTQLYQCSSDVIDGKLVTSITQQQNRHIAKTISTYATLDKENYEFVKYLLPEFELITGHSVYALELIYCTKEMFDIYICPNISLSTGCTHKNLNGCRSMRDDILDDHVSIEQIGPYFNVYSSAKTYKINPNGQPKPMPTNNHLIIKVKHGEMFMIGSTSKNGNADETKVMSTFENTYKESSDSMIMMKEEHLLALVIGFMLVVVFSIVCCAMCVCCARHRRQNNRRPY